SAARLLESARANARRPWLRPLRSELTPPYSCLVRTLEGYGYGRLSAASVTRDGRLVVSISLEGTITIWDVKSGQAMRVIELPHHDSPATTVCVTPDGRRVVSGSEDGTIHQWDLDTG